MKKLPQINCDLGEGIKSEESIFPWIDAASVACGGHFGDQESMAKTLELAKKYGKKAGSHPSYPDKENFGRKSMKISIENLIDSIHSQIENFQKESRDLDISMDHIKFHGALYNDAARDERLADQLTDFLQEAFPKSIIFCSPASFMERFSIKKGLNFKLEVFADRAYNSDLSLVSRTIRGSLLSDYESISSHLEVLFSEGKILSASGDKLPVNADTLCFHGDNPGLNHFLPKIRKKWWN
ncbi:LamB/YcsF family protein [Algoriphagus aestuarii]|nr:LamB/YcsF family protein [Algoriphagus aestuarii]